MALLEVQNLSISFSIQDQTLYAVRDVSFKLFEGETLGIVGESGSGKTALVQSLLRLTQSKIESGTALLDGQDLLKASPQELYKIRGREISMVFQDPMTSLNPTMRIGDQIAESIIYHRIASRKIAHERALELLRLVGIADPKMRFFQLPHQLSGGIRQRILIAIALAARPRILIADEPTTALDATTQSQILHLLRDLRSQLGMSQIIITHNMGVVSELCDRVLVMYAGKIVEEGNVDEVLASPRHPYTNMLLRSIPTLKTKPREKLFTIEGSPPSLFTPPRGCPFAERCPHAMKICENSFPPTHNKTACWLYDPRYSDASASAAR